MAQLSFICRWFAFQIGALGMDFDHRYGIWLGWGLKPGPLRRFAKKWNHEFMRVI